MKLPIDIDIDIDIDIEVRYSIMINLISSTLLLIVQLSIIWETPMQHNLGLIEKGRTVSTQFTYRNTGNAPLILENVRTSCGCTAPNWSKHPVLPDSIGKISITYRASRKGKFQKSIKVYFQGIPKAERLYIKGRVN